MVCRNCLSEVPPGPTCARCGLPLEANPIGGEPAMVLAGAERAGSMPLSFGQRAQLIVECLPLPFFVLALVFTLTILDDITGAPPPLGLPLFLGFVIFVVGWAALNRMRDLASGVALVREDVLQRSWRSGGSRGLHPFKGKFQQLGTMRLTAKAWGQGQNGARYRVYYSPASKIVWSLERIR
ncbi:MAG TPA: hypothetical protein VKE41_17750 [Roseiflexaceae bacterium]|nr:hypothetical protein [Roseiflexaceae bacterium]